jgi:hypothetical protein
MALSPRRPCAVATSRHDVAPSTGTSLADDQATGPCSADLRLAVQRRVAAPTGPPNQSPAWPPTPCSAVAPPRWWPPLAGPRLAKHRAEPRVHCNRQTTNPGAHSPPTGDEATGRPWPFRWNQNGLYRKGRGKSGWTGEYESEPTPQQYVAHTVEAFGEDRRVLRPDAATRRRVEATAHRGRGPRTDGTPPSAPSSARNSRALPRGPRLTDSWTQSSSIRSSEPAQQPQVPAWLRLE